LHLNDAILAKAKPELALTDVAGLSANDTDRLWVLLAAALVFLMQAGFLAFEVGCVRPRNVASVAQKNIIDWVVVTAVFFLCGFGLMFGPTLGGFVGTDLFALVGLDDADGIPLRYVFFAFQLAFAGTAATIVSGAMAERTSFTTYLLVAMATALIIYPVFGHWAWGNLFFPTNDTLLTRIGFMDFAGATVVHSVGGWIGLVGVWFLGPRLGRYGTRGRLRQVESYSVPWSALGVFILWIGWWGFNGGSLLALNERVGLIITNTNIAAAVGGLSAFVHAWYAQKRADLNAKFFGGILGGLVAITACCNVVTPLSAVAVGALAGIVHNTSYDLVIKRLRLDDAVGAVPVHLFCGILGTLSVAIFGESELLTHPRWTQLGVQLVGIVICGLWTASTAAFTFKLLQSTLGLRVSPEEEAAGIDIARRKPPTPPADDGDLDEAEIRQLMSE
jgi:Amt family ammonium transporter